MKSTLARIEQLETRLRYIKSQPKPVQVIRIHLASPDPLPPEYNAAWDPGLRVWLYDHVCDLQKPGVVYEASSLLHHLDDSKSNSTGDGNTEATPSNNTLRPDIPTSQPVKRKKGIKMHASSRSLSVKQIRALGHVLCSKSLSEAAQAAGIPEHTIRRWMKSYPEFQAALRDADHEAVTAISRRLVAGQMKALDVLETLMTTATSENVRRQAALDWLGLCVRYRGSVDITERLIALEDEHRGSSPPGNSREGPPKPRSN